VLTRHAITRRADADGVDASIVERDYILAHVVAQLHGATPKDGGTLIFEGGTALRFIHIGDYRYSADLDFTLIGGEVGPAIAALGDVLEAARQDAALPFLGLTTTTNPPSHIRTDVHSHQARMWLGGMREYETWAWP